MNYSRPDSNWCDGFALKVLSFTPGFSAVQVKKATRGQAFDSSIRASTQGLSHYESTCFG
jgi:hypothetical protein